MSPALQVYLPEFDEDFFRLPKELQQRIEQRIDRLGANIANYPHQKLTGYNGFKLRVGNYRVLYRFDLEAGKLILLAIGHRREVYRDI